ncbi:MAG: hypothetical protein U9N86_16280 [Bacteroidota bacterium]|nr:hypothetical protein [Bacteroidota bacterium]
MLKKIASVVLILCFVFVLATEFQSNSYDMGYSHGKSDGKRDASWLWVFAGLGCNCVGAAVAYFVPGDVPSEKIVGMGAEYSMGYADAYIKTKRWRQVMWAGIGIIINSTIVGAGASTYGN